jgi:3-deoxy-D-manno-octulosonate 8-phosphate phosphatase (KDO 8-P phosphatase)
LLRTRERTLAARCAAVEWLVLDVDGVLTEGSITYTGDGQELKHFHVRDGAGLRVWQGVGKRAAILSGRHSAAVEVRAAELGITVVCQGAKHKLPTYHQLLAEHRIRPEQVCFVGDDVPDLSILRNCGLAVAVADAAPALLQAADYVTRAAGGRGAVREVIELILRCTGAWQQMMAQDCSRQS